MLAAALAVLLGACFGGDDDGVAPGSAPGTPAAVPTATPYATLPEPIIVTGATPSSGGGEATYIVQPGDSLLAIASRFDTTVSAIQSLNGLQTTDIFVGQQLRIPTGGGSGPTRPPPAGGGEIYVVQAGDTASAIAARFNTTLGELAAANGLTVDELTNLRIGQELQIPPPR
jgi:LysM repeat protein